MRAAQPLPARSNSSQGRKGRKPAGEGSGWISTGATSTDFRRVTEGCLVTYDRLHQNVNRATNWPDLGFVPAPLRVFTKPKPPFSAPVGAAEPGNGLLNVAAVTEEVPAPPPVAGIGYCTRLKTLKNCA